MDERHVPSISREKENVSLTYRAPIPILLVYDFYCKKKL